MLANLAANVQPAASASLLAPVAPVVDPTSAPTDGEAVIDIPCARRFATPK